MYDDDELEERYSPLCRAIGSLWCCGALLSSRTINVPGRSSRLLKVSGLLRRRSAIFTTVEVKVAWRRGGKRLCSPFVFWGVVVEGQNQNKPKKEAGIGESVSPSKTSDSASFLALWLI